MKNLKYFLILMLLGMSCQKDEPVATNGNISGRVTDKISNEPVSGAAVTFNGNQIITGSDGTFGVNDIYADTYQISVSKPGYASDSKSVNVSPERTSRADFALSRLLPTSNPSNLSFNRENLEKTLILENKQSERLSYTLESSKFWISALPQSGTIESGNQKAITVSINPQTLDFGTYNETLIVNVSSSSLLIPITFIYEQEPFISIVSPETDGVFKMGEIMPISWESNLNGKVKIEFLKSNSVLKTIIEATDNQEGGSFAWEIPVLSPEAYTVRITSVEFPGISTQSGAFLINEGPTKPVVLTGETTEISVNSINIKGQIESLGLQAAEVTQHGHVYSSSNELPTISDNRTNLGSTTNVGEYVSLISGLIPGESYYIRAYALNEKGAAYGDSKLVSTVIGAPALTTLTADDITQTQVTLSGSLDSNGGGTVSEKGFLWGVTAPLNSDSEKIIAEGTTEGEYSVDLTSLSPGVTYYFKAYAINPNGIGYGDQKNFKTKGTEATVFTFDPINISATKLKARGRIDSNGGESLTSYGFVFATNENPTLNNKKVEVGNSDFTGEYSFDITGLNPSTNYYIRSYATNVINTSYGDQKLVTTPDGTPEVETSEISSYNATSAIVKGKIIDNAGEELISYGIVYSTEANPTLESEKVEANENSNGVFSLSLEELQPSTKYYVRAYATNAIATGYGDQLSFSTENGLASVSTIDAKNITYNSVKLDGNYIREGASTTSELGFVIGFEPTVDITSGNKHPIETIQTGEISIELSELEEKTKYFYKAYAKNDYGIAYGANKSFTTLEKPYLSILSPTGFSEGTLGEPLEIKWTTNMGNTLINIDVVNILNESAPIAIGLTASSGSINWIIPEQYAEGDYKILITDKSSSELLAETSFFRIIKGCEDIAIQDTSFEKWLFDNGYDDLLDNKLNTCKISSITELINPDISTRINWDYFVNLERLTITTNNYNADIDLRDNHKLSILTILGGINYSGKIYPNIELKELHSTIPEIGNSYIGLSSTRISDYPNLEVYDLPKQTFFIEHDDVFRNLQEVTSNGVNGEADFTSYPNLKRLSINFISKSNLIILKNNLKIENLILSTDTSSSDYTVNTSQCYNKIWVHGSVNTSGWKLLDRIVINESCFNVSKSTLKTLNEDDSENITTLGNPIYTSNRYGQAKKALKLDGVDDVINGGVSSVIFPTNLNTNNLIFWIKIESGFSGYKSIYSDQKRNANGNYQFNLTVSDEEKLIKLSYNGREVNKSAQLTFNKFDQWLPVIIKVKNEYQHGNAEYTIVPTLYLGGVGDISFSVRDLFRSGGNEVSTTIGAKKSNILSVELSEFLKISVDDLWGYNRFITNSEIYLIMKDWVSYN